LGTQVLATCIAIFGLGLVTPLGWNWALLVWGYALAWALVNDRIKLLTYWALDRSKVGAQSQTKVASQLEVNSADHDQAKAAGEPDAKGPPQEGADPVCKPEIESKSDTTLKPGAAGKPETTTPPETGAKTSPPQTAEVAGMAQPASETAAGPETKAAAETSAGVDQKSEAHAEPNQEASIGIAKLINTTLGDILLAGVLKDPEGAGRIIAEAISHAGAPGAAMTATERDGTPGVKSNAEPQPDAMAKAPSASTPATAK
jgi:hypothetical protein